MQVSTGKGGWKSKLGWMFRLVSLLILLFLFVFVSGAMISTPASVFPCVITGCVFAELWHMSETSYFYDENIVINKKDL